MADPGASLAIELRRLLPDLRRAVGDHRQVLVGFDRGGWSPALFAHMHAQGFDVLTWRKGLAEDVDHDLFTDLTHVDQTGRTHQWRVADTNVDPPEGDNDQGGSGGRRDGEIGRDLVGGQHPGGDQSATIALIDELRDDHPVDEILIILKQGAVISGWGKVFNQPSLIALTHDHTLTNAGDPLVFTT
jgi:hypothetical protein